MGRLLNLNGKGLITFEGLVLIQYSSLSLVADLVGTPVASTRLIQGTQTNANYLTISCYPTGYRTTLFQPPENWSIEIPYLAKGENIFTVTAYNETGQITSEVRTTYNPAVTLATGTIKVQPYVMTPTGLLPMNPRILKDGRVIPIETRIGCADANAQLTGLSMSILATDLMALPRHATVELSGLSMAVTQGTLAGVSNTITLSGQLDIVDDSGPYYKSWTAPSGTTVKRIHYNFVNGSYNKFSIFAGIKANPAFSDLGIFSATTRGSGWVDVPAGVTALTTAIFYGSLPAIEHLTIDTIELNI